MTNERQTNDLDYPEKSALGKAGIFFLEFIKIAILAGITIWVVRYFLFKPFYVKGQSMEPNFHEKEYLIVDEITYRFRDPLRGEVIVFRPPIAQKDYYLKRIIGLPGETIKINKEKVVIINKENPRGIILYEPYLSEITNGEMTVTLSDDQYFVMGDNRNESSDSRSFGPINKKTIVGRAIFRGWPFNSVTVFNKLPDYNSKLKIN